MYRALAVAVGFALIPLVSGAQEANPYNGQWVARWKNPMGATVEARVIIKQIVRGCSDSGLRATRDGEKRLEGKFRDGTAVILERQ
jgi:hypothetical protein